MGIRTEPPKKRTTGHVRQKNKGKQAGWCRGKMEKQTSPLQCSKGRDRHTPSRVNTMVIASPMSETIMGPFTKRICVLAKPCLGQGKRKKDTSMNEEKERCGSSTKQILSTYRQMAIVRTRVRRQDTSCSKTNLNDEIKQSEPKSQNRQWCKSSSHVAARETRKHTDSSKVTRQC